MRHDQHRSTLLIVLVGPKGSGKSHIGRLLQARLGVHFLDVEPLWLAYHRACASEGRAVSLQEGLRFVRPALEAALAAWPHVSVETTGASPEILDDLLSLRARVPLRIARVWAPASTCLERIAARDAARHIPTPRATIDEARERSVALELEADVLLDNTALTEDEIVAAFRPLLVAAPGD